MCMTLAEADMLLAEEQASGRVAQVGYMRRHAAAFTEAKQSLQSMTDIRLARVHAVIGRNALIIGELADVVRPTDLPPSSAEALRTAAAERTVAAIGSAPETLQSAYALLLGLSSHDLSAMRDLLGVPARVLYAASRGVDGRAISAAFDYGGFVCQFETLVDSIPRFDSHIEVYTPGRVLRVEYDTPYVRGIPGRIVTDDVGADGLARHTVRHAWKDSFEIEWRNFHDNVAGNRRPAMSLSDAREDLVLFREMIECMRHAVTFR
jgi:predicted dehydrogenase